MTRTIPFLLDAIQLFKGRSLSYAGLDVEQIGHVYEPLRKTVHRVADDHPTKRVHQQQKTHLSRFMK